MTESEKGEDGRLPRGMRIGARRREAVRKISMRGKDKCKILKQIRRQIADENDIPYVVEECKHKGECKGTCPKCEAELRELERELSVRHRLGKAIALAGISAGLIASTTACDLEDAAHALLQAVGIESDTPVQGMMEKRNLPDSGEVTMGDFIIKPDESERDVTEGEAQINPDDFFETPEDFILPSEREK